MSVGEVRCKCGNGYLIAIVVDEDCGESYKGWIWIEVRGW